MSGSLFITGASGFIATHLLSRLSPHRYDPITCLSRTPHPPAAPGASMRWVVGDLAEPATYAAHLGGADTVVHLAAATGAKGRDEYTRINAEATARLVAECERAGVRRFLYVSSIAAKFDDARYQYGLSKRAGEEAVRRGRLRYAIVRPTIVAGRSSHAWRKLASLATGPVTVLVGDGTARIQPIHVDDVAAGLARIIDAEMFDGARYDLGGPEVLTIETLVRRMRRAHDGRAPHVLHLPYAPMAWALSLLERPLGALLPVNAGQLSPFVRDGTIDSNELFLQLRPSMRTVDEMIGLTMRDG